MQRILASIILSFLICSPLWSLSWSSVNIDKVTAAAMSAAYETETLVEGNTASNINKIFDHYKSAGLASAGIFQSMKKLRDARRNPGLFASEENYYYQRIFRLVKDGIMPKFITVTGKMLKQPDNAIHWGPYLLKTTTNVENLCKQFEVVVTNGKRSFKDIRFLVLNEDLQKIFDLAQLGEVDWKSLLGKLGEFGTGITQEEIAEDYKNLGSIIAQAGKAAYDSNLESASKIGAIFKAKPKEITKLYKSFKNTINPLRMPVTSRNCCLPWWEKAMKMQWKNSFRQVAITLRDISLPTSRNYRDSITLRDGISTSMIPGRKLNVNIVHLAMRDMVMPDGKKHGTFIPVVKNVKPMGRFHVINPFLRMRTRK